MRAAFFEPLHFIFQIYAWVQRGVEYFQFESSSSASSSSPDSSSHRRIVQVNVFAFKDITIYEFPILAERDQISSKTTSVRFLADIILTQRYRKKIRIYLGKGRCARVVGIHKT